jgi:hypothetical protein
MSVPAPHPEVPEVAARLVFSGQAGPARARVIERSPAWRRTSAFRELLWLLLLPLAALVPPHAPWIVVLIAFASYRAFNRMRERRTLVSLRGTCPKCGTEQEFSEIGRMKEPDHTVNCAGCRWDLRVEVPLSGAAT